MMFPTKEAAICVVISLLIVASKCNGTGYEPAPNCAKNECPAYTVVHSQKEFEIRSYKDARWMSVPNISPNSYNTSTVRQGFLMLLGYFKGENSVNVEMNMTSPIIVGVENSAYTVYFYLPEKYQNNTPSALKDEIKEVTLPGHKYAAVRRIDGEISDESVPIHVNALKESLKSTAYQRAATGDMFMVAAYSSPFDLINLVNEIIVWFD